MKKYHQNTKIPGFTLVEMLVVIGLFSSIATLSLGSLFNAQSINSRLQDTQAILDNVNLSVQTVVRDIRFASEFYATTTVTIPTIVPGGNDSGATSYVYVKTIPPVLSTKRRNCGYGDGARGKCDALVFRSIDAETGNDRTALYIENGILYKKEIPESGSPTILQMTAPDVVIKSLTFYVKGANTSDGSNDEGGVSDNEQPLITLFISGETKPSKTTVPPSSFSIQTNISAREPDNQ